MTTISKERLAQLERAEAKLEALEAGGVDNWEWYDESLKEWRKENELTERREELVTEFMEAISPYLYEPSERGAGFALDESGFEEAVGVLIRYKVTFEDLE